MPIMIYTATINTKRTRKIEIPRAFPAAVPVPNPESRKRLNPLFSKFIK